MTDYDDLCPICISNEPEYLTECGHSYCVTCLCRINKCALCRKVLVRSKICCEIRNHKKNRNQHDDNELYDPHVDEYIISENDISEDDNDSITVEINRRPIRMMAGMGPVGFWF